MKKNMLIIIGVIAIIASGTIIFGITNKKESENSTEKKEVNKDDKKDDKKSGIKAELIEYETFEPEKRKVVKNYEPKVGDVISLKEYEGNDIKILEITDSYVKISRTKIGYEVIDQKNMLSEAYTENVEEKIEYNKEITININETDPFGPVYDAPKYSYVFKFVK